MTTTYSDAGVTFADGSVQAKAVPSSPQSMIRLNTANGYGSTNTVIRRFTTVVTSQGSDITYADSATLGASFTINTNGVYAMSYTEDFSTVGIMGISVNTATPTTGIISIAASERLCACTAGGADFAPCASNTPYLLSGSVIRPHTAGNASGGFPGLTTFTITRVA